MCNDLMGGHIGLQVSNATAAEKLKNASTVDNKMMRAMRPMLASKRSASSETLLALGRAATRSITVSEKRSSGTPSAIAPSPTRPTSSG